MARILVVDDDPQIRRMLHLILEKQGYEVVLASNGKEAILLQKNAPADLVLTDLIMPEKEGIETIRELTTQYPDIKIIAMSGGGIVEPEAYLRIAEGLGAVRTFRKPLNRKELLEGIKQVLGEN